MENSTLISIVIPCYNDAQYIEQSVFSALNQTYSKVEVIVVDDGSNAETKEILKQLESKITKLITQENKGQSTARNVGIQEAKGEYILVLDSDDFIESGYCGKIVKALQSDQDIKLVVCETNLHFENGEIRRYLPQGGHVQNFLFFNAATGTSAFRIKDWEECGGYEENMRQGFEDWEFFIRLLKEGGYCYVIPEVLYHYRKKNSSTTTIANSKKYALLEYIYLKHQELYKIYFNSFVVFMLSRVEKEESEKLKSQQRIEFRLGKIILKPFRWFKLILNKYNRD